MNTINMTLTPRQAEALLEAAVRAQVNWNDPDYSHLKPGYPVRLALDSAIEELREALK